MTSAPIYSNRLGAIGDAQFAAALQKAGLGRLLSARPAPGGLFGQNVFLGASSGEYVFRGAPHWHRGRPNDAWQFPKERLYADLLHERTAVPVAWPQRLDDTCEHFPWPYLIVPRLPGLCLADESARAGLGRLDFLDVARAMGEALAGLQALTWDFAGDFDPETQSLVAYADGYARHLTAEIDRIAGAARAHDGLNAADDAWLEDIAAADRGSAEPGRSVFVHNDYHLGNVLVERTDDAWRVSGVVDLMTACFGDPAADLVRQACDWFDVAPPCAEAFIAAYRRAGGVANPSPARLARLVVYERLLIWGYFTQPSVADARFAGKTFRAWAEPYVLRLTRAWFGAPDAS